MTEQATQFTPAVYEESSQVQRKREALGELGAHAFKEPWWLRGRHPQSAWSPFFRKTGYVFDRLERWETPDGDFLRLHFVDGAPNKPVLLLLHGLEGSVRSNYIPGLAKEVTPHGWTAAAMEYRSCGGEMNRAKRLYHSGDTGDLAFVVDELGQRYRGRPVYIAGVSLGGNITAKWLGEVGEAAPDYVRAAAAICPPFNLSRGGPYIDRLLGGVYTRWFMRSLVPKALAKERQFPGTLDVERVRVCRSFREFDTHVTAALHGFRDAEDYWAQCGCGQFLPDVRRPLLLLASANDPFNPPGTLPREIAGSSPWLHPIFVDRGGHVGFVYGETPWRTRHWAEEQTGRFFRQYARLLGDA